jgi:hypothetical protein
LKKEASASFFCLCEEFVPTGERDSETRELVATEPGRQGDRETGRQGDRETGRQGDRETGRQGDRETGRQGDRETGR